MERLDAKSNILSCPFVDVNGVVQSENSEYWENIKIPAYAPAGNLGPVTKPGGKVDDRRFIPWFGPDEGLRDAAAIRWARFNKESKRVMHTGSKKNREAVYQAASQLLELQAVDLATNFPDAYAIEDDSVTGKTIVNKVTGNRFAVETAATDLHPLAKVGLLSQEDICIVQETKKGKHIMVGGFLATQTEWDLKAVVGEDMDAIHESVDGYFKPVKGSPVKIPLKTTVDRALASLPEYPTRQIARNNIFLKRSGSLALLPEQPHPYRLKDLTDPGSQIFVRSERETLTRLPSTERYPDGNKMIIFNIMANVINLGQMAASPRREEFIEALKTNDVLREDKKLAKIAIKYLQNYAT